MADREKVIKKFADFVKSFSKRDDTYYNGLFNSVLALLKEQEAEIDEISDEYLDLGNEIAKTPKVVRCKECWKRNYDNCPFREWADVFPPDDFYCADGERKSD